MPSLHHPRGTHLSLSDTCCPLCHSSHTAPRYIARRVGGALGAMAGAASGAAAGGIGGLAADGEAPSHWPVVQAVAGAVIGALVSATAGCRIGASLGEVLDDSVLQRWQCQSCGFSFGLRSRSGTSPSDFADPRDPDDGLGFHDAG